MIIYIPDDALELIPVKAICELAAKNGCYLESRWKNGEASLIVVPRNQKMTHEPIDVEHIRQEERSRRSRS